jgi:hypothetical protein
MKPIGVQLPDEWIDKMDELADEHDIERSAVMRSVIDNGLRAHKYYPEEFEIVPEAFEQSDAVKLAKEGKLNR